MKFKLHYACDMVYYNNCENKKKSRFALIINMFSTKYSIIM